MLRTNCKGHSGGGIEGHYKNTQKEGQWLLAFHRNESLCFKFSIVASTLPQVIGLLKEIILYLEMKLCLEIP